jgi:hypothetical protein
MTIYNSLLALLACVLVAAMVTPSVSAYSGIGDVLLRTFGVFHEQPLTAAEAESLGWTRATQSCLPGIGNVYVPSGGDVASDSQFLIYAASGQLAGFGVTVFGVTFEAPLVDQFWMRTGDQAYSVHVTTRDPNLVCNPSATFSGAIGDRVLINGGVLEVPTTMAAAEAAGWYQGNCIPKMGIHHSYDLAAPGAMTWNASTLVPVMPMFDAVNHTINAVLFQVPHVQYLEPVGDWEGPIFPFLMCKNWCSSDSSVCHWPGVSMFATMHWLFVHPSSISCSGAKCSI